jgi:Family of unknown function (DUF5691)
LVEALATELTTGDVAFLQGLANDRSDKVRKAAAHLMARLGQSDTDPLATEAAAMFEIASEGFIWRRKVLRVIPKAKDGQLRSLAQTLPEISLLGLLQALGFGASESVDLWEPDNLPQPVLLALSTMIARTAADSEVAAYWRKLNGQPDVARSSLPLLFPLLSAADQEASCLRLVARSGLGAAVDILSLTGAAVPAPVSAALTSDRKAMANLVNPARDTTPETAASARADAQRLASALSIFGLLLTASDAGLVLVFVGWSRQTDRARA